LETRTVWKPSWEANRRSTEAFRKNVGGDLEAVWGEPESDGRGGESTTGREVLRKLAKDDPGKLAQIAYGLLPRDVFISVEQRTPGNLDPSEWAVMVELVRLIKASAPEGSQALPSDIVPGIEETVRAHFAKPIEN
jgi:hypothetical protein